MDEKLQNLAGMIWIRRSNDVFPNASTRNSSSTESSPDKKLNLSTEKQKHLIFLEHDSFFDKEYSDEELCLEEDSSSPPKLREIDYPYDASFPSRKVQFFRNIHPAEKKAIWFYRASTIARALENEEEKIPPFSSNIDELAEFCMNSKSIISTSALDPNVPDFIPGTNDLMVNDLTMRQSDVPKRRPGTRLRKPMIQDPELLEPSHPLNIYPDYPKVISSDIGKLLDQIDAQRLNNLGRSSELDSNTVNFIPTVPVSIEMDTKARVICSHSSPSTIPTATVQPSIMENLVNQQSANQPLYQIEKEQQYQNTVSANQLPYQNEVSLDQQQYQTTSELLYQSGLPISQLQHKSEAPAYHQKYASAVLSVSDQLPYQSILSGQHTSEAPICHQSYPSAVLSVSADQLPYQSILPRQDKSEASICHQSYPSTVLSVSADQSTYQSTLSASQPQFQNGMLTNPPPHQSMLDQPTYQSRISINQEQYQNNQLPYHNETSASQSYHNEIYSNIQQYQDGITANNNGISTNGQQLQLQVECQLSRPLPSISMPAVSNQSSMPTERYNQPLEVISHNAPQTSQPITMIHNSNRIEIMERISELPVHNAVQHVEPTITLLQLNDLLANSSFPHWPNNEKIRQEAQNIFSQIQPPDNNHLMQETNLLAKNQSQYSYEQNQMRNHQGPGQGAQNTSSQFQPPTHYYPAQEKNLFANNQNQMRACQEPDQRGKNIYPLLQPSTNYYPVQEKNPFAKNNENKMSICQEPDQRAQNTSSQLQPPNNYLQMQEHNQFSGFGSTTKKHSEDGPLHSNIMPQTLQADFKKLASHIQSLENLENDYRPRYKNIANMRIQENSLPQFLEKQRSEECQIQGILKTSNRMISENKVGFGSDSVFEPESIQNPKKVAFSTE